MELSEILNVLLGSGLMATLVGLLSLRSALKKAVAEAEKSLAEADGVKITNTDQATRILIDNIVEPLKQELYETRKELSSFKREVARFRKAVNSANSCRYSDECPVLERMRDAPKEDGSAVRDDGPISSLGQRVSSSSGGRQRGVRGSSESRSCPSVGGDSADTFGESADSPV